METAIKKWLQRLHLLHQRSGGKNKLYLTILNASHAIIMQ